MNLNLCVLIKAVLTIYSLIRMNGTKYLSIMDWQGARSTLVRMLDYLTSIWRRALLVTPPLHSLKKRDQN